jgi:hypothetical protein
MRTRENESGSSLKLASKARNNHRVHEFFRRACLNARDTINSRRAFDAIRAAMAARRADSGTAVDLAGLGQLTSTTTTRPQTAVEEAA